WVKLYVFNPMGGVVRNNTLKTLFNVLFIFVIIGLWHGASYNFFFFGLLAGIYMIIDYATKDLRLSFFKRIHFTKNRIIPRFIFKFVTVTSFLTLGIFFRASDIDESLIIIKKV